MTPARRTQKERVEESTRRLFAAAADLIAEGGYEQATAAEIARRAGYSRGMVHARFGSKEGLIDAVLAELWENPLGVEHTEAATGLERVLSRLDTAARMVQENPKLLRAMFAIELRSAGERSGLAARVAQGTTRIHRDIAGAIRAGQDDGSIDPEVDAEAMAYAMVAEAAGAAFLWTIDYRDFGEHIVSWRTQILRALQARDAG